ncbi:hypothetical protein BHE74_00011655 [Ensete ventricosum]|nr:hypothetical protein GW17_00013230 [Ensete ventricosum]RWW80016.1 hypothetical protein BHE74_00011655 [Ensete ventricosum]RZR90863.1 hypothetical protein BHM03_00018846 [Ensete ventricosum]
MGVSAASPSSCCLPHARSHLGPSRFTSLPVLIPFSKKRPGFCRATKQQQQTGAAKKKAGRRKAPERPSVDDGGRPVDVVPGPQNRQSHSSPLPKPPAGFVLDDHGRVLLASSKRIVTIVHDGESIEGLPTEGVKITCFNLVILDGTNYMIYTPSDPLLFVAVRDKNGVLQIADDVSKSSFVFFVQRL